MLILRIAILGIGSIGGMLLGALADSGVELIAVSKGYMASQISERGLTLNTPEGTVEHFPSELFTVIDSESIPIPINLANSCDFALICGKSHSTPILTQLASELLSKEGIAISLQNGLGHSEYLSKKIGQGNVLGCTITHGAWRDMNSVHWAGRGNIILGSLEGKSPSPKINDFISLLESSNLSPRWSEDIYKEIWIKLLINIAINPISAITGLRNGEILVRNDIWTQSCSTMLEASIIAKSSGIDVDYEDLIYKLKSVIKSTEKNRCSMLQDIMNGKKTEIDSLCGEIVFRGESLGIPTPLNSMLYAIIKGIEDNTKIE
ncbi:MAG: 2-dehydropantoate 2-reductase [Candidatus Poseidoniales archaeon]|nr:MAG: 2-dehydropantoate 2-reductase [Candidatus Poseidoniales archaeon]